MNLLNKNTIEMSLKYCDNRIKLFVTISILFLCSLSATSQVVIEGKILSKKDSSPIIGAYIQIKGTQVGTTSDKNGEYLISNVSTGDSYKIEVSAIGYKTKVHSLKKSTVVGKDSHIIDFLLDEDTEMLSEVSVVSSGVKRLQQSAYNAVAIDTKALQNTTKNLSDALSMLPGIKLRENGGVGSDMQLMLDGFSGKHVKIFIDGIPQEGVGSAFSINNIPVEFADRIEVYRGVVPVGFGSDALGGVINVVTKKNRNRWFLDASYSYGSFNTHKSNLVFGQTLKNGLTYEINAFQNYSDNDYYINTFVTQFLEDGTTSTDKEKIERVRRFNDTYHNEAIVGKIGWVGKSWADRLVFKLTYSRVYKEIQNGVRQSIVFGQKHRRGYSLIPSIEYKKHNFFIQGLDLSMTANYNYNHSNNIDTAAFVYNWYGEKKPTGAAGEQSNQFSESMSYSWNGVLNMMYNINPHHEVIFNHIFSSFERESRSLIGSTSRLTDFDIPKITIKNISGISYKYTLSKKFNASVFGKYYNQHNSGPVSKDANGIGNYVNMKKSSSTFGYGTALTYSPLRSLQAKFSYEKAVRLPSTDELFGDEDLESGKATLLPERSDNFNLNISYTLNIKKTHGLYLEGGVIYRNTKDYIRRTLEKFGATNYASYENHGQVSTQGFNISARYNYLHWISLGATFNVMNIRDDEPYLEGNSLQPNYHYKARIPNQPYEFANFDATFLYKNFIGKGNDLSLTYDAYYQKEFPLEWENIGDPTTKKRVPTQFSHNLALTYSIQNGRYNISFECRNLTDERLFDNFELQKAGRAFYGKIRVHFGGDGDNKYKHKK